MTREEMTKAIILAEWKMFQDVPNIGGRAACQDERNTFEIMRSSQSASWSEAVLESYLQDLSKAEEQGRNLMTEKYGRMMKSTSPAEYARIEHLLPSLSVDVVDYIDKISRIVMDWEEELANRYPAIFAHGRPIRSSGDSLYTTSIETYLKCELATYSLSTLKLYYKHVSRQKSEDINGSEITLLQTVKSYGYPSLAEANRKLSIN